MALYLIDSDITIDHLEDDPVATAILDRLREDDVAISVVTYMEVYQGIFHTPAPALAQAKLDIFLLRVPILDFTPPIARRCAALREYLRARGKRVRPRHLDLINAATAIEYDRRFVTRNRADYADIPGLVLV